MRTWEAVCSGCMLFFFNLSFRDECLPPNLQLLLPLVSGCYLFSESAYILPHKSGWGVRVRPAVQTGLLWVPSVRTSLDRGRVNTSFYRRQIKVCPSKISPQKEPEQQVPDFPQYLCSWLKPYPLDDFGIL